MESIVISNVLIVSSGTASIESVLNNFDKSESQDGTSSVSSGDIDSVDDTDTSSYEESVLLSSDSYQSLDLEYDQLLSEVQQLNVGVQHVELQLEACISILLIFVVVGLLNYIYKFFKIFF